MSNIMNEPVGILDSGVGGLTAVVAMQEALQGESIVYLGDSLRMPYGNKSPQEIVKLASHLIRFLEDCGVKVILLACNTISSYIDKLESSVKLFSIIEAGALAACEIVKEPSVGLIATKATTDMGMYEFTIAKHNPYIDVVSNSSASLPKIIDSQLENKPLLYENIREVLDPVLKKDKRIKSLILGCSHFPIIKNEISHIYPDIRLIDPAIKQVDMLKSYLTRNNLLNDTGDPKITLFTTAETYEYAAAIKRLNLEVDALLKVALDID
ncbi:MAG: glutamate racemase [Eubacteriaceae bacterium]|nr:glutamate racemase [Eubacteriaceae bacterium]